MKLTEEEKNEIYSMYKTGDYYLKEIAEWIGCSVSTVMSVVRKKREEERNEEKYKNRRKVN